MRPDYITVLLAGVIGITGPGITLWISAKRDLRLKQLEWQGDYRERELVRPVIELVAEVAEEIAKEVSTADQQVRPPAEYYVGKRLRYRTTFNALRPRVLALADKTLVDHYDALLDHYRSLLTHIEQNHPDRVPAVMRSAQEAAGLILEAVQPGTQPEQPWWRRILRR
jgi:hypothetical protein